MKLSFQPTQLFDLAGHPLVSGRVSIYYKDSDTLADTFVRDGEGYVSGQNPVILDNAGEFTNTLFLEAAIYDVVVEKYTDGVYHQIQNFEFGFEMPNFNNTAVVDGIQGLMDANPELGSVTVVGYDQYVYCGARTYIWDANCTDAADGGAVIESNSNETGRWILCSNLREMPSTFYGVVPGHESNMSAFLTAPSIVGSFGIVIPPVPRFVGGDYQSGGTFSVAKTISFDPTARFLNAKFVCHSAEITSSNTQYVADFQFTKWAEAHSSWFRTVNSFWTCDARKLIQDSTNYFTDTDVDLTVTVSNSQIEGKPITVTGQGRVVFDKCDFSPKCLSTEWRTKFQNVSISDRWFADSNWNVGTSNDYRQVIIVSEVTMDLSNFDNANVYTLIMAANSQTKLDLDGRSIAYIDKDWSFTEIRNAVIAEAHISHDTNLESVTCYALHFEDGVSQCTLKNCIATIEEASAALIAMSYCTVSLNCDVDTLVATLNILQSSVDINQHKVGPSDTADFTLHGTVTFKYSIVTNGTVCSNGLFLQQSQFADVQFGLYPYGAGGTYAYLLAVDGNTFSGTSQLAFRPNAGGDDKADCFEVDIHSFSITNNWFSTVGDGITMPFWASDGEHRFMKGQVTDCGFAYEQQMVGQGYSHGYDTVWTHEFLYSNNRGQCPAEYVECNGPTLGIAGGFNLYDGTTQIHYINRSPTVGYRVFCLPVTREDGGSTVSEHWVIDGSAKACTPYKAKYNLAAEEVIGDFPYTMLIPTCAVDNSQPNDMFTVTVATNDTYGIISQMAVFGRKA